MYIFYIFDIKSNLKLITMNFRLIFILFVSLNVVTVFPANSQPEGILWSQEFVEANGDRMNDIIYDSGTNVYMFVYTKTKGDRIVPGILRLDSQMEAKQRKDYSAALTVKGDVMMIGLFYCKNSFVMLTYVDDKESDVRKVYASLIDIETLEPKQVSAEIWQVPILKGRNLNMSYKISSDTSLFVLNATSNYGTWVPEYSGWDPVKSTVLFKVFDSKLNPINERKKELNYVSDRYTRLNYFLNNDGNMFYFSKKYTNKKQGSVIKNDEGKHVAMYNLSVLQYHPNGMDKETDILLGEKLLEDVSADYDPKSNDLIVFIIYGDIENAKTSSPLKYSTSYEFLRFNTSTGEIVNRKMHEFSNSLVEILKIKETSGVLKKTRYISNLFGIFDVKVMEDGRVYLVLTRDYTSDIQKVSQGTICYLHDLDGNIKWENFIPKRQQFNQKNDYIYSAIVYRSDKVIFIYNEHTMIHKYDPFLKDMEPRIYNSWTESVLMKVEINNEGIMTHGPIATSEQMNTSIRPSKSIAGKGDRFILYGWKIKSESTKIGLMQLN
jgi:hypothetical protein